MWRLMGMESCCEFGPACHKRKRGKQRLPITRERITSAAFVYTQLYLYTPSIVIGVRQILGELGEEAR